MMSPMSVAKYLPPNSVEFDLVVFDEASQVKPVDAFGSIARGSQTVVVGDSKQLPPTSFFDASREGDEEVYDSVGDMESILSLFLAQGTPERMLRWHYRSEHDSLIAVSNNEFYENRLVVFPSPGISPYARGLNFHHLPTNHYDRGGTRTNVGEAKDIAVAVMKHARELPDLSLGVVAFSVAQRDAIEVQLEILRRADSSCEAFFGSGRLEPFFVKNLENVQGDERDVIFISVGYGKNQDGYMSMHFGPLSNDGGERRLNVLISRAKKAMDVFSNFTAGDVDLNRAKARGVVALKHFLAYAETGILEQPYSTDKEPDSPFEEAVIKALHLRGYQLEPQVGTAGFFVDIGVVNPEKPGSYLLGIECDGATYHSSRSARDRDRLRQEVLERLGWRLHRIWSTEWFREPEVELERAIAAIEEARKRQHDVEEATATASIRSTPEIERDPVSKQEQACAEVRYDAYELHTPNVQLAGRELHELSSREMAGYVAEVVRVESPVHRDEVAKRIREGAWLQRAGSRIQAAVESGIRSAVRMGKVERRGQFLWNPEQEKPSVRNRSNLENSEKKFEFVAPEEIAAAIQSEVERSFSMTASDAVSAAGRALGFQRVTAQASRMIHRQLTELVASGQLVLEDDRVRAS
jgi:very-short-patch-repair endonuclease